MRKNKNRDIDSFKNLRSIKLPNPIRIFGIFIIVFIVLIVALLSLTPWQQTSRGSGRVIALDPNDRVQDISSPISGRIKKWHVKDGMRVKKGDIIAELEDNDPQILERIRMERDAKERKLKVSEIASRTAKYDYERQKSLLSQGLSSSQNVEVAKIKYKKLLAEEEAAIADLTASEIKLARQERQIIYAPKDGVILNILVGNDTSIVKMGAKIASFAPDLNDPAVELYVSSNDIPLIHEGRNVRLQFEGWPVIQFSGWPSMAIGTFSGVVSAVDSSISSNGMFRVIVSKVDGEDWPDSRFLRHGTKVYGWILLNNVKLGYELWRKVNGFPPEFDKPSLQLDNRK